MAKKLTPKQKLFVKEYIVDFNATRAAKAAGYSPDTAYSIASELLKKLEIQEALQKEMDKRAKRVEVSQDFVLEQLRKIAGADIKDYVEYEEDGNLRFKPYSDIDGQAVAEISVMTSSVGTKRKVKLHDKMKALELLMRHLGMYKDVVSLKKEPDAISPEELEEIEQEMRQESNQKLEENEPKKEK